MAQVPANQDRQQYKQQNGWCYPCWWNLSLTCVCLCKKLAYDSILVSTLYLAYSASSLQALVSTSLVATPTLLYLIQSLHSSHKSHVREQCKNPCDGPSVGDEPSVTQFLDSHVLLPEKVSAHNNLLFHPAESLRAAGTNVPEKYPAHANAGLKSILTEGSWKRFHSTCIKIIPACDSG